MSTINEVIEAVIGLMNGLQPFATVTRGALSTGPGITCEPDPSSADELYMDKNTCARLALVINGKHHDLKTLSDALNDIYGALTRAVEYPSGTAWQIIDIDATNSTPPRLIGRENNNDWLMAAVLSVKFYWRG